MHRLNLTIDEALYEKTRAFSFLEKKSISQIIRESLSEYIARHIERGEQVDLLLNAEDENEVLQILKNDTCASREDFISQITEQPVEVGPDLTFLTREEAHER